MRARRAPSSASAAAGSPSPSSSSAAPRAPRRRRSGQEEEREEEWRGQLRRRRGRRRRAAPGNPRSAASSASSTEVYDGEERAATAAAAAMAASEYCDVVLSSGFLAFGSHCGFLSALEDSCAMTAPAPAPAPAGGARAGPRLRGVMGTSSGAITGSLLASGYTASEIEEIILTRPPVSHLRLSGFPRIFTTGVYSMRSLVDYLGEYLPRTFEELERPFAVGVVDRQTRKYELISSGPLVEAVVASAAVPFLFQPIDARLGARKGDRAGRRRQYVDGGIVDRVGVKHWRRYCNSDAGRARMREFYRRDEMNGGAGQRARAGEYDATPSFVHVVSRSTQFSGSDSISKQERKANLVVVRSPSANMFKTSLMNMGDFEDAKATTRSITKRAVRGLL